MTALCPACENPLVVCCELHERHIAVYCSQGKCPSKKSNDGATGRTEAEALEKFMKMMEKEDVE